MNGTAAEHRGHGDVAKGEDRQAGLPEERLGSTVASGVFTLAGGAAAYFLSLTLLEPRGLLAGPNNLFYLTIVGALTALLLTRGPARRVGRVWASTVNRAASVGPDVVVSVIVGATVGLVLTILVNTVLADIPGFTWYWSVLIAVIAVVGCAGFFVANRRVLPGLRSAGAAIAASSGPWHDKVVDGPGDSRSELWFVYHLGKRLKELYADSTDPRDEPIRNITLDYPVRGDRQEPDAEEVLKEINGYTWPERRQIADPAELRDDGSTACGSWLYVGAFPEEGHNQTRSRRPDGPDGPGTHLGWAFAWPANRRTLYNRASADPDGNPWSDAKKLTWWDAAAGKWRSADEIDFEIDKAPGYRPDWSETPTGMDAIGGADPFILMPDGRGQMFVTAGLKEGPLPTHYEPIESPVHNALYPQQFSPTAKRWARADNPLHEIADERYPHVLTTYRLTEHHTGGTPTRSVPSTAELQPEGFAELPPELASEIGVRNLDWIVISTARGEIETRALVTERLQPFRINGSRVYQVGMPWHFGWEGYATGDVANVLTAIVGDANTSMHENKALTCALRRGRLRPEGRP